jgi:hypothetical protein
MLWTEVSDQKPTPGVSLPVDVVPVALLLSATQ